jgi:uncharacterized protein
MIVDLRTISNGPRYVDLAFEPGWWHGDEHYDQILGLDGPLESRIAISKAGTKYVLEGHLKGVLRVRCDRCIEPYHYDLESSFRLFLALAPAGADESELELSEEDLSVDFVVGDEINLDEIVKEQVYLSLPMKTVCREECAGLCPICGANLNEEACECHREMGHPGFQKLKKAKLYRK